MPIDWNEVGKALSPIRDYEDLCQQLRGSFAYSFVRKSFNLSMPGLARYTELLLGGDSQGRYTEYSKGLVSTFAELHQAGVRDLMDLQARVETREHLEVFSERSRIPALDTVAVLKYVFYWFVPRQRLMSGLVRDNPDISAAIEVLRGSGIRTNLQLLERGITPAGRKSLAEVSGLPQATILELVNRADFSRLPWASKATISNIMGAGYGSLAQLASADAGQLYVDFFRYGKSIGKNLKLGNEIENSYRIAKIVPALLQGD